ncbi:hypothetical protein [Natronorarus salvus]|uniref:hypothetical protein n=1 Tax=Natronorarus salvus TaxID=3117733 RepID=UPI002F269645
MVEEDKLDFTDLFAGDEEAEDIEWEGIELEKRPRGILSHTDREFLWGLREYAHAQSESNRKQDIRERVINALYDYPLLAVLLDEGERDKIFQEETNEEDLNRCLEWIITFIYLGLGQDEDRFEDLIERGIYFGANFDKDGRWVGEATDVEVSIDIEYNPDVDKLYNQLQQGEGDELSPAEIGVLVQAGKLDADDLGELEDSEPKFPRVSTGLN